MRVFFHMLDKKQGKNILDREYYKYKIVGRGTEGNRIFKVRLLTGKLNFKRKAGEKKEKGEKKMKCKRI